MIVCKLENSFALSERLVLLMLISKEIQCKVGALHFINQFHAEDILVKVQGNLGIFNTNHRALYKFCIQIHTDENGS